MSIKIFSNTVASRDLTQVQQKSFYYAFWEAIRQLSTTGDCRITLRNFGRYTASNGKVKFKSSDYFNGLLASKKVTPEDQLAFEKSSQLSAVIFAKLSGRGLTPGDVDFLIKKMQTAILYTIHGRKSFIVRHVGKHYPLTLKATTRKMRIAGLTSLVDSPSKDICRFKQA